MLIESTCLILFLLLLNKLYHFVFDKPPGNVPPGLPRLPIWGSYWFLLWGNYKFPHHTLKYYVKKYKSKVVSYWLGDYFMVVATSYETVKELLSKKEFDGRPTEAYVAKARAFGKTLGIFFNDGQSWKEQRRFALRHMRDFGFGRRMDSIESDFAEELNTLVETLKNGPITEHERTYLKDGKAYFPDVLYPISTNFFLAVFTGERLPRAEHKVLHDVSLASGAFQRHTEPTGGAILATPWLRHFAHGFSYPGLIESSARITNFVKKCFKSQESSFIEDAERGFIDSCIKRLKESDLFSKYTEEQLLMVGTDFMFASLTANPWGVTTFVKYMMHHPHVMLKVREEIYKIVGKGRLVTLNDRVNLPYVDATIREMLRSASMTPWSVPHRAVQEGELGGYHIPVDTVLITDLHSMHHDPELWGDPENFRPERFLNEDGSLGKDRTLPFGAGGRLCAGETFARQFLFLTFSTLVQNFDFGFVEGEPSGLEDKLTGFLTSPKELWIKVTPRE